MAVFDCLDFKLRIMVRGYERSFAILRFFDSFPLKTKPESELDYISW